MPPGFEVTDPDIEALQLGDTARAAAYALKKAHPTVRFTSGRRSTSDQARAMASNVVKQRQWIVQTYRPSIVCTKCQEWVDSHPEKKTQAEIAAGLLSIFDTMSDEVMSRFSKHLGGQAFDVQPLEDGPKARAIKATIAALPGKTKFLEKEGNLVRWHVEF